jgi:hypothetical protein
MEVVPLLKRAALLLACALATGSPAEMRSEPTPGDPGDGVVKTALLSFPEFFCAFTELSTPYAYIGFALQIEGRVRYFKTSTTTCDTLRVSPAEESGVPFHVPMFGEQVTVYGGNAPSRLRRENGDVYDIEPSENSTTRSFFLPSVVLTGFENPKSLPGNPHPELLRRECRLLTDASERDLCLWSQAGLLNEEGICEELSKARRGKCRTWLGNILSGRINQ